jgi:hypothetical protein
MLLPVSFGIKPSRCCRSDLAVPAIAADDAAWEEYILGADSARSPREAQQEREQCIVADLETDGMVDDLQADHQPRDDAGEPDTELRRKSIYATNSLESASPSEADDDMLMEQIESEYADSFNGDVPSFKSSPKSRESSAEPADMPVEHTALSAREPSEDGEPTGIDADSTSAPFSFAPTWPPAVPAPPPGELRPSSRMASTPIHESRTTTPAADLEGIRVRSAFVGNDYFRQVHRDPMTMPRQGRADRSTRALSQGGEEPQRLGEALNMAQTWQGRELKHNLMDTATIESIWAMLQDDDGAHPAACSSLSQSSPSQSVSVGASFPR